MRTVFKEHADIDAVIHFAAYSLVAESMADPLKCFDNNTAGMVKILKSCMNVGHHIVFLFFHGIPEEIPILKPLHKTNQSTGESKLMMETIMRWADQALRGSSTCPFVTLIAGAKPDGSTEKTMTDPSPATVLQVAQGKREKILFLEMTTRHQMAPMFGTAFIHLTLGRCPSLAVTPRNGNPSTAFDSNY